MKIGHTTRTLLAGTTLYVVMAACSASDRGGPSRNFGADGGPLGDAHGIIDAFVDELAAPVSDAKAGPLAPDVATETCNSTGTYQGAATSFAVHNYPGKTVEDLSAVRIFGQLTNGGASIGGSSYADSPSPLTFIRPGSIAVYCGVVGGAAQFNTVTFVLPQ
jgi:hypothetical protein